MKRTIKISASDDTVKVKLTAHVDTGDALTFYEVSKLKERLTNNLHEALRSNFSVTEIKIL